MRNYRFLTLIGVLMLHAQTEAQVTFPQNGISDPRHHYYAFTGATIVKDANTVLTNATMIIRDGLIVGVGNNIIVPADAVTIDAAGKYIYPSFIDVYSDYGMPAKPPRPAGNSRGQLTSNTKGAFGWNQAISSETDAAAVFSNDETKAKTLRDLGFGTVLTHVKDGIARGTGTVVTLNTNDAENLVMLKEKASLIIPSAKVLQLRRYPTSLMGSIALLRQTYLDGNGTLPAT